MSTEIINQLTETLASLKDSKAAFEVWAKPNPNAVTERRAWIVEHNRDLNNIISTPAGLAEWKSREPGLAGMPSVIEARKRVVDLQNELAAAKADLSELERDSGD